MGEELKYTIFSTSAGWVGVLGSSKGLRRLTLPQRSQDEAYLLLGREARDAQPSPFEDLSNRLIRYFDGDEVSFPDELDLSGTPFELEVWRVVRLIPYGETQSYKWVAKMVGRPGAARAVGGALGRNPLPIIIPCHRVVASDGGLGGFGGGLEMKRHLLSLEAWKKPRSA